MHSLHLASENSDAPRFPRAKQRDLETIMIKFPERQIERWQRAREILTSKEIKSLGINLEDIKNAILIIDWYIYFYEEMLNGKNPDIDPETTMEEMLFLEKLIPFKSKDNGKIILLTKITMEWNRLIKGTQ